MSVKVVAECGVNWKNLEEAEKMIVEAAKSGAHYVKFQLFNEKTLADYSRDLFDQLKSLILTEDNVKTLRAVAERERIGFILTPMYLEAVDIAGTYADYIKIRFKDNENMDMIDKALHTTKDLLISGLNRPIDMTLNFNPHIHWLYCIPKYPPNPEDFCLEYAAAMQGMSSHYPHFLFDIAYVINRNWQECFIEKHVMFDLLDFAEQPIDAAVSVTFPQMKQFIANVAVLEKMRRLRTLVI